MATPSARRPLPALAFLIGLSVVTAFVWWRVIHRSNSDPQQNTGQSATATCAPANPNQVPPAASVTLQVFNTTDRAGLAGTAQKSLIAVGFKAAGDPANTTPLFTEVANIKYLKANEGAAKLVAAYIPGATLTVAAPAAGIVEVDLGSKFTAVSSPDDAAKALAAAKLTVASSSASAACRTG